jgi:hypothetical protein
MKGDRGKKGARNVLVISHLSIVYVCAGEECQTEISDVAHCRLRTGRYIWFY